jgi:hypothetical protein
MQSASESLGSCGRCGVVEGWRNCERHAVHVGLLEPRLGVCNPLFIQHIYGENAASLQHQKYLHLFSVACIRESERVSAGVDKFPAARARRNSNKISLHTKVLKMVRNEKLMSFIFFIPHKLNYFPFSLTSNSLPAQSKQWES